MLLARQSLPAAQSCHVRLFSQPPKGPAQKPSNPTRWLFPSKTTSRRLSGKPLPQRRSVVLNFLYRSAAIFGTGIGFVGFLAAAFFVYDATTYKETSDNEEARVSEYALSPRRGGPKNLPIAEALIDDDDTGVLHMATFTCPQSIFSYVVRDRVWQNLSQPLPLAFRHQVSVLEEQRAGLSVLRVLK